MDDDALILAVKFYQTAAGNMPVREWLRSLDADTRKRIGEDIKTVQYGWPIGMPVVRKLEADLWEVRSTIRAGIVRVIFTVVGDKMVLLHGFVKKAQKTPQTDLDTARCRLSEVKNGEDNDE